jgi:RNA ligase (TIGR02306 family)
MSEVTITVERIEAIKPHPNADKMEIAEVAGTQTLVGKDQFKVGDLAVYFPPDILIPGEVSEALGVAKYLKTALYGGLRVPCRVAACRLRGVPSYGFAQPLTVLGTVDLRQIHVGKDVTETFRGLKYEPVVKVQRGHGGGTGEVWGGLAPEPINFHRYTDIQHYRKYRHLLATETPVRITEKVHGCLMFQERITMVDGSKKKIGHTSALVILFLGL